MAPECSSFLAVAHLWSAALLLHSFLVLALTDDAMQRKEYCLTGTLIESSRENMANKASVYFLSGCFSLYHSRSLSRSLNLSIVFLYFFFLSLSLFLCISASFSFEAHLTR